jgi:hypothetical protein
VAIPATNNLDMAGFQIFNLKLQALAADPSGLIAADEGRVWYNTSTDQIRYWDGAQVQSVVFGSTAPSGPAGGDLAGNYPNPTVAPLAVTTGKIADGAVTSAKIADGTIVDADIAAGAAIAKAKLAALNIVDADIAAGAAILLSKLAVDPLARANHTGTQTAATISDFAFATDARVTNIVGGRNVANGFAGLDANGLLPTGLLPALAITNTFVVASQAAMLALAAEPGDVAIRTDIHDSFILQGADPTVLANWQELQSPVDGVQSVTGAGPITSTGGVNPQIGLAAGGVTSAHIADGTIVAGDMQDATITGAKIANLTIATTNVADLAITNAKIADGAVTSAKIADGTIVGTDIAALAIGTTNIADGAVTSAKIADGTIVNADVAAAAAIAVSKISGAVRAYEQDVGDGAATVYAIPHNLGSTQVAAVSVRRNSDGKNTLTEWDVTDANTITLRFGTPPALNAYHVVVSGKV